MYILLLSAAVLYVAWRQGQGIQEMKRLRALLDASVSLHELEEQVMPAIDRLEQEATRLKREMQQLARQTCAPTVHDAAPASALQAWGDPVETEDSDDLPEEEDVSSDADDLPQESTPDVSSVLMNMSLQALLQPSVPVVAVPTTKVLLTSCRMPTAAGSQPLIEEYEPSGPGPDAASN